MKTAFGFVLSLALIGGTLGVPADAAERYAYSQTQFAKAQAEGRPILVHVTASWCTVCMVQDSLIERDLFTPEFAKIVLFDVDFDSQKDVLRQFNVSSVSTLIVFKNGMETVRLIGGADPDVIEAAMRRALD